MSSLYGNHLGARHGRHAAGAVLSPPFRAFRKALAFIAFAAAAAVLLSGTVANARPFDGPRATVGGPSGTAATVPIAPTMVQFSAGEYANLVDRATRALPPQVPRPVTDWRQTFLQRLPLDGAALQNVHITIDAPPFDFTRLAGADPVERASLIAERKASLDAAYAPVVARLSAGGATRVEYNWLTNGIDAVVPASFAREVVRWPFVLGVASNDAHGSAGAFNGNDVRTSMKVQELGVYNGKRPGSLAPLTLAVVEWDTVKTPAGTRITNNLDVSHVGWLDTPNGPTRLTGRFFLYNHNVQPRHYRRYAIAWHGRDVGCRLEHP